MKNTELVITEIVKIIVKSIQYINKIKQLLSQQLSLFRFYIIVLHL